MFCDEFEYFCSLNICLAWGVLTHKQLYTCYLFCLNHVPVGTMTAIIVVHVKL